MLSEVGFNVNSESKNRFKSTSNRLVQRNLPKSRNVNDVSNPISLGMEPVKELEAVLYMVSKIAREGHIFQSIWEFYF